MNLNENFIMLPRNDLAFKMLFGDKRNKNLLVDLLAAILHRDKAQLEDLEYINTDLLQELPNDKQGILDVRIKQEQGTQINIEIQVYPLKTMLNRSLFYWSRMYASQLNKGASYALLKPCIAINIVNFAIIDLDMPHTSWHITEDHVGKRLNDTFEMHFLELPKIRQGEEHVEERLLTWMQFLAADSREVLEMLARKDEVYKEAYEQLEIMSMDEQARMKYEAREAWLKDEATRQYEARMDGLQKGREEGLQEGREKGLQEGREKGIKGLIITLVDLGIDEENILKRLEKNYDLSPEKAQGFYEQYCVKY